MKQDTNVMKKPTGSLCSLFGTYPIISSDLKGSKYKMRQNYFSNEDFKRKKPQEILSKKGLAVSFSKNQFVSPTINMNQGLFV